VLRVSQALAAPAGQKEVVPGEQRQAVLQFSIGQLQVVEQAPGAEAAGDSRALQEEADSNLAWEQSVRMYPGATLFLVLLRTLASSQQAQLAPRALAAPPQGQRVARRASKLRAARMQVLQASGPEASQPVPQAEPEPRA
jgi:hypothetical protein